MINNLYIEYKLLLRFSIGHCLCTYIGIRLSESDCHLICRTYVHTKAKLEVEMGSVLTHHFGLSNVGIDSSHSLVTKHLLENDKAIIRSNYHPINM